MTINFAIKLKSWLNIFIKPPPPPARDVQGLAENELEVG